MQITLKQDAIVSALKMYVENQGISLVNKDLSVNFTAGRKGTGIVADILIEQSQAQEAQQIAQSKVASTLLPQQDPGAPEAATAAPTTAQAEALAEAEAESATTADEAVEGKTPVSLFG